MNCLLYTRVSTDQQETVQQDTLCARYAELKGFTVTATCSDPDTSGGTDFSERDGGAAVFAAVRQGVRHVIIAKLDRLGRSAMNVLETVRQFGELGVTLHIVDMGGETLTSTGPAGRLLLLILAGVAEFERELIRSRIKDKLDLKFSKGEVIEIGRAHV